jgi:Ca-activated chloride channel family protein
MGEVTLSCKLARNYTMAGVDDALAYLLIKLVPDTSSDFGSLPLNIGLVIDISGSMRGGKIKNAKRAAKMVVEALKPEDTVSITIFSDQARAIVPGTKVIDKYSIMSAIDKISIVGGTRLYHGLEVAAREMRRTMTPMSINRMLILTDGETEGEEQCSIIARQEYANKITVATFGVGNEYNEDFLKELSDITLGGFYHLQDPEQTAHEFRKELSDVSAAVISDVSLSLNLIPDVKFDKIHRIYPNIAQLHPEIQADGNLIAVPAGNLRKDEQSVFGAELRLPNRAPGRVRMAQVFVSYSVPSMGIEDRVVKQDIIVQFTDDTDLCGQVDKEVISNFNQLMVQSMVAKATREAKDGNIPGATQALNQAHQFTQRIGNVPLTRNLEEAIEELKQKGVISPGMIKTVRAGSGHTVRIEDAENA